MKILILKDKLSIALKTVSYVTEQNTTDKTNEHCILFQIIKNNLTIISTTKSLEITYDILLNYSEKDIIFSISLKKINSIVKVIPNNELLEIIKHNEELLINVKNLKFRICLSSDFTPNITNFSGIDNLSFFISSIQLQIIYKKIFFSVPENDMRQYLNGIFFDIKGNLLYTISSDGHRLSMYKINLFNNINIFKQIIIPGKNFHNIINIFQKYEDVKVFIYNNYIKLIAENVTVKSSLLFGKYPEYSSILFNVYGNYLICYKKDILDLFLRVSVLDKKTDNVVKMNLNNKYIHLLTYTNIRESVEDKIEFIYYKGKDITIAFNSKYIIDILNSITFDIILITISDFKNAIIIEPFDYNKNIENITIEQIEEIKKLNNNIYILMPIRL